MTLPGTVVSQLPDVTSDERWAAWVARGVEHDKREGRRAFAMAVVVASGFGLWFAISLFRG
jgi:hypothetical protein